MLSKTLKTIYRIENNTVLSSVRKGFVMIVPALLAGSIALLIKNLPIPAFQAFLQSFAGGFIADFLVTVFYSTVGLMSAFLTLSITYYYSLKFSENDFSLQILAMLTSLACFSALFGALSGSLRLEDFGTEGVFTSMLCSILATRLFFALFKLLPKRILADAEGVDSEYRISMLALLPVIACIAVFALVNLLLSRLFGINNINELISRSISAVFVNIKSDLANGVLYTFLLNLLWFFGIHGGNALDAVAQQVFSADTGGIMTKSFMDIFSSIGGSGTTLCLVLAMLMISRSKSDRQLAKAAAPLTLFNINEIIVFGIPVVLNPIMLIPFICVPITSLLIAYGAAASGIMPLIQNDVMWTTPVIFSGYIATGSIIGMLVQLVNVAVGVVIYIPFVQLSKRMLDTRTDFMLSEITADYQLHEHTAQKGTYLNRYDNMGSVARSMVSKMKNDLEGDNIRTYYQPVISDSGKVVGGEALMRWDYAEHTIYPRLALTLAREDGCIDKLTWRLCQDACKDILMLQINVGADLCFSINVLAAQLGDLSFINSFIALARESGIASNVVFEVTEDIFAGDYPYIEENIQVLRENNVSLIMDNFGLGELPLEKLEDDIFKYVKLDEMLVSKARTDAHCRRIIKDIVEHSQTCRYEVVAEYVETVEANETVKELGVKLFQGDFHCSAIPLNEFVHFCNRSNAEQ